MRKRRKTREEFLQELFLRKRGKKSLRNFRLESLDVAALMDDDEMGDSSDEADDNEANASRNNSDIKMDRPPKGTEPHYALFRKRVECFLQGTPDIHQRKSPCSL